MPAFVDWNSLLFGSPEIGSERHQVEHHQEDASHLELDASVPWSEVPRNEVPRGEVPRGAVAWSTVPWNAVSWSGDSQFTVAAIFLGSVLIWYWLGRRKRSYVASRRLMDQEVSLNAIKRDFAQRTEALERQFDEAARQRVEAIETQFDETLRRRVEALEEQFQKALSDQAENIEDHVRKSLNKRVETLEVRIKLDQEALEDVHRALSERMEAFESYVRTIDAKQLDQEANSIAQRTLGQRLNTVEEDFRNVDAKARASAQRIEAIDDSVRMIDSRAKALSQRIEAAEDNLNTTDGQVTLLSHDVNRGSSVIEKLQRQVKMLPDSEKFKALSRTWETKLKKLEAKLDETQKSIEEHLAEPPPSLTWSHIESVEIEPSGPMYTRPHALSLDGSSVSPSSSSVRSHSTNGSHTRTYSTVSSSPALPMTPDRKRIDSVGFRETTFSSRQKLLAYRGESWSA
ncbi:hypothetical protein F5Y19DRAFT_473797 [Xylariaceae sp. FL1651]|nr:hypothetical protein F5Y19DRAFT_473797 [Xylariaceae sp. FL1651]